MATVRALTQAVSRVGCGGGWGGDDVSNPSLLLGQHGETGQHPGCRPGSDLSIQTGPWFFPGGKTESVACLSEDRTVMGWGKIQEGERVKALLQSPSVNIFYYIVAMGLTRSWWSWMFAPIPISGQQRCRAWKGLLPVRQSTVGLQAVPESLGCTTIGG